MSQAEIDRFVEDLKTNEALRNELSGQASGISSIVAFATGKGYDITSDEAGAYISDAAGRDLSDHELDAVAGGKAAPGSGDPAVAQVASVLDGQAVAVAALTTTAETTTSTGAIAMVVVD